MDNIFEISELGIANNIGVHVDCCNSGFLLPFITLNGTNSKAYDFSLPGVTSISIDTYKYGCCLNGASLILYRKPGIRAGATCVFEIVDGQQRITTILLYLLGLTKIFSDHF